MCPHAEFHDDSPTVYHSKFCPVPAREGRRRAATGGGAPAGRDKRWRRAGVEMGLGFGRQGREGLGRVALSLFDLFSNVFFQIFSETFFPLMDGSGG